MHRMAFYGCLARVYQKGNLLSFTTDFQSFMTPTTPERFCNANDFKFQPSSAPIRQV